MNKTTDTIFWLITGLISLVILFIIAEATMTAGKEPSAPSPPKIVTLYDCNGQVIKQWKVASDELVREYGPGYYFENLETGKPIEVSGTVVVEE